MAVCVGCLLARSVPPRGPPHANIMLIGERPGKDEVLLNQPFIGRSGQLLRAALFENGIDPEDCWITNAVKCYAEGNKTPTLKEIGRCQQQLYEEIYQVAPIVIVTLGATGLKALGLGKEVGPARSNRELRWRDYPVIAAYHPAAALRSPSFKAAFYKDIERLAEWLGFLDVAKEERDYRVIPPTREGWEELEYIASRVSGDDVLAIDTEYDEEGLYCWSFSLSAGMGRVVFPSRWAPNYLGIMNRMLKGVGTVVFHQAPADLPVLRAHGLYLPDEWLDVGKIHDTLVLGYVLRVAPLGLKPLAESLLGLKVARMEEFRGKKDKKTGEYEVRLRDVDQEKLAEYSAQDADLTWRLFQVLSERLEDGDGNGNLS